MKIKSGNVVFSVGIPFLAAAAFFLAGDMRKNYILALLFSALHETGHILALLFFGRKPKEITLGIMGIRIETNNAMLSYRQECIVALAGPAVNLVLAVIFAFTDMSGLPFAVNAGLFIVNILPVKTLDGGRFINNLILSRSDAEKAVKIMNSLEITTVVKLVTVLILSLLTDCANTSFVFFSVTLVIIIVLQFVV